ncbi:hypothetical protein DFO47_101357 [Arthrobacter sp. AG258]|nr:hypothetical protein DFO47_101357 [Arthrobacter sp. AG258]
MNGAIGDRREHPNFVGAWWDDDVTSQIQRDTPNDATTAIPVLPYGPEQSRWFIKRLQENWRNGHEAS